MSKIRFLTIGLMVSACAVSALAYDYDPVFHSTDVLAARDEYGKLHQGPWLNPTDFEARYPLRASYYLESSHSLTSQPAYVGALQAALRRLGYYCGPLDGNFTSEVSDAIARMQKNYSMRVTGTLTVPVRRALFLP
jgi:Putative peptidoglycan binding domain